METVPMWVWMLDDAVAAWGRELERGGGSRAEAGPGRDGTGAEASGG